MAGEVRVTQVGVEVLEARTDAYVRTTQVGVEVLEARTDAYVRTTQVGVEVLLHHKPYITAISDTCLAVGQALTIDGGDFHALQGTGYVSFTGGGVAAITSWANAQIVCTVPVGTTRGVVTVTDSDGYTSDGYAYGMHPIIAVVPLVGAIGDPITISGLHFGAVQGAGGVTVGGIVAAITSWSNIQVVATIPAGVPPGGAAIILTNDDGCASNAVNFTVTAGVVGGRRRGLQIPPIGWPIGGGLGRPPIMG